MHTYSLHTERPYAGQVIWYINGEKQAATGTIFMPAFALPGQKTVTARLSETYEQAELVTEIRSYQGVVLESLVPNPFSPDEEELVLRNTNLFSVTLRDWRLQSQASPIFVAITTVIPPTATVTLRSSNKLINHGGGYGLYTEANQLVDVATYGMAIPGERLYRSQTQWRFPAYDAVEDDRSVVLNPVSSPVAQASGSPPSPNTSVVKKPLPAAVFLEPVVPRSAWMRLWISLLVSVGVVLNLSSYWKKPV